MPDADNSAKRREYDQNRGITYPLVSDPDYKSIPFGERRRLKKEQHGSSEEFNEYQDGVEQNQRRSNRNQRARTLNKVINRGRAPKLKKGQKMTAKMFARGRAMMAAGEIFMICVYLYIVQLIGFIFQLAGVAIEAGADALYISWLVSGSGLLVLGAGWVLSAIAGIITTIVMIGIFTSMRVPFLNSPLKVVTFVFAFFLFLAPLNPLPIFLLWLAVIVCTAGE